MSEWERMTPAELNTCVRAAGQLRRQEQELTELNIYNAAMALRACLFAKRAPSFEAVFPRQRGRGEEMDDEALYRQAEALNRLFGGGDE